MELRGTVDLTHFKAVLREVANYFDCNLKGQEGEGTVQNHSRPNMT